MRKMLQPGKTRSVLEKYYAEISRNSFHLIDFDEYDRYIKGNSGELPIKLIPSGIPSGHWWWFHPAEPPNDWGNRVGYIEVE